MNDDAVRSIDVAGGGYFVLEDGCAPEVQLGEVASGERGAQGCARELGIVVEPGEAG